MEYNNLNNNYYYTNNIMNIDNYSNSDLQSLCCFCFDVLINKLNNKSEKIEFPVLFKNVFFFLISKKKFFKIFLNKKKVFPLFVTWRIGQEKFLRGCVGTFLYEILEESLEKYALTSAFNDLRFKPISCQEIPYLHVGVSLLLNFEQISYGLDWEVGKHGIQIKFKDIQSIIFLL